MVMPSFTHCALAHPLLCRIEDIPCTAWSAHIVYVRNTVANSLVAHIPRADDVVSSQHFFPLATKRTRIDTPFKDRAI